MGELGRYPEHIKSIIAAVKYWVRMEKNSNNILLQNAFNVCKSENHAWFQDLKHVMNKNGLQYIVNNVHDLHEKYIVAKVKQRLLDQHNQSYCCKLENCKYSVLINDNERKTNYKSSSYLENIKTPYIRAFLTNIRLCGAAKFNREMYNPLYLEQKCNLCNKEGSEGIVHTMLFCEKISDARLDFTNGISCYVNKFNELTNPEKVKHIVNNCFFLSNKNNEQKVTDILCKFLKILYVNCISNPGVAAS